MSAFGSVRADGGELENYRRGCELVSELAIVAQTPESGTTRAVELNRHTLGSMNPRALRKWLGCTVVEPGGIEPPTSCI
jgi:hypothetical protein